MKWTQETLEACEDVNVLTGGVGGMSVGLSVAEKLGKLFLQTHLQPISAPTAAYPGVLLAGTPLWLGKPGLLLSHYLSDFALWMPFQKAMAKARREIWVWRERQELQRVIRSFTGLAHTRCRWLRRAATLARLRGIGRLPGTVLPRGNRLRHLRSSSNSMHDG